MQKFQTAITSPTGDIIPNAVITVVTLDGSPATIYAGNGVNPYPTNQLTTNSQGEFSFYAANGRYSYTVAATNYVTEAYTDFLLYDPASSLVSSSTIDQSQVLMELIAQAEDGAAIELPAELRLNRPVLMPQDKSIQIGTDGRCTLYFGNNACFIVGGVDLTLTGAAGVFNMREQVTIGGTWVVSATSITGTFTVGQTVSLSSGGTAVLERYQSSRQAFQLYTGSNTPISAGVVITNGVGGSATVGATVASTINGITIYDSPVTGVCVAAQFEVGDYNGSNFLRAIQLYGNIKAGRTITGVTSGATATISTVTVQDAQGPSAGKPIFKGFSLESDAWNTGLFLHIENSVAGTVNDVFDLNGLHTMFRSRNNNSSGDPGFTENWSFENIICRNPTFFHHCSIDPFGAASMATTTYRRVTVSLNKPTTVTEPGQLAGYPFASCGVYIGTNCSHYRSRYDIQIFIQRGDQAVLPLTPYTGSVGFYCDGAMRGAGGIVTFEGAGSTVYATAWMFGPNASSVSNGIWCHYNGISTTYNSLDPEANTDDGNIDEMWIDPACTAYISFQSSLFGASRNTMVGNGKQALLSIARAGDPESLPGEPNGSPFEAYYASNDEVQFRYPRGFLAGITTNEVNSTVTAQAFRSIPVGDVVSITDSSAASWSRWNPTYGLVEVGGISNLNITPAANIIVNGFYAPGQEAPGRLMLVKLNPVNAAITLTYSTEFRLRSGTNLVLNQGDNQVLLLMVQHDMPAAGTVFKLLTAYAFGAIVFDPADDYASYSCTAVSGVTSVALFPSEDPTNWATIANNYPSKWSEIARSVWGSFNTTLSVSSAYVNANTLPDIARVTVANAATLQGFTGGRAGQMITIVGGTGGGTVIHGTTANRIRLQNSINLTLPQNMVLTVVADENLLWRSMGVQVQT